MAVDSVRDLLFGIMGGSALLMYGVDLMGEGLEKAAGKLIKKVLSVLTGKLWSAFLVGTAVTTLVQSSTAVTVLTVGFVNAGLMGLKQAVGIIYGANIGTTVTVQLMAFNLTEIALPALGLGFMIMYFSKKESVKYIGQGIMGFGMLFLGMKLLNMGTPYLNSNPLVVNFFKQYSDNLIISVLAGMLATILVQSSAAVMGITLILSQSNLIGLYGAIGLMLGSNVGTCATAQLAAVTGNVAAKRTAWAHTIYNVIGALAAIIVIRPFIWVIEALSPGMPIERQIANSHTIFNVLSAVVFLPVTDYYVKFIKKLVPNRRVRK